jgi:hypothetical protein
VLGTYGCAPFVRRFTAVFLVFTALFGVIGVVATVLAPQLSDIPVLITSLVLFFGGLGSAARFVCQSRNVRGFLMAWFQDRLG